MDKNELIHLLRVAETALWDAVFKDVPSAEAAHREITRALRELTDTGSCGECGKTLAQADTGRQRLYCSDKCRKAAHRKRNAQVAA
jgi:hypothetical protein